jgi:hypothetical protein
VSKIQALQQQLADAEREAQAIRAELDEAVSVGRSQAITEIQALMVEWDITLADLGCQRRTRRTKQATEQQDQTPEPTAVDAERLDAIEDEQEADQEPLQEAA